MANRRVRRARWLAGPAIEEWLNTSFHRQYRGGGGRWGVVVHDSKAKDFLVNQARRWQRQICGTGSSPENKG